jgi:hypothetical protein
VMQTTAQGQHRPNTHDPGSIHSCEHWSPVLYAMTCLASRARSLSRSVTSLLRLRLRLRLPRSPLHATLPYMQGFTPSRRTKAWAGSALVALVPRLRQMPADIRFRGVVWLRRRDDRRCRRTGPLA